jgi:predicted pyridoxine 5'-phosphate oxidase superfamily flavin-nucleotide-binding protein
MPHEVLEPLIDEELRAFVEGPRSLIVGTVDGDGQPDATRAWAADVLPGAREIRLLIGENAAVSLANLRANGRIALTVTDFVTLDSTQVKGRVTVVEERTSGDQVRFEANCARCMQILVEIDHTTDEVVRRFMPPGVIACVMTVEQVFDQTPGPAAGTQLAPIGVAS